MAQDEAILRIQIGEDPNASPAAGGGGGGTTNAPAPGTSFGPAVPAGMKEDLENKLKELAEKLTPKLPTPDTTFGPTLPPKMQLARDVQDRIGKEHQAQLFKSAYQNATEGPAEAIDPRLGEIQKATGLNIGSKGASLLGESVPGVIAAITAMEVFGKVADGAIVGIRALGDQTSRLAKNDFFGMFDNAAHGAIDAVEGIGKTFGPAGELIAHTITAIPRVALAAFESFKQVSDAFVQRAQQIQQYSGDILQANAVADIRQMMADVREAKALGKDMARLIDARSSISVDLQDTFQPLKEVILGAVADITESVANTLHDITKEDLPIALEAALRASSNILLWGLPGIIDKAGAKRAADRRAAEIAKEGADIFKGFFDAIEKMKLPPNAYAPRQ
jgi:hypothetical protein